MAAILDVRTLISARADHKVVLAPAISRLFEDFHAHIVRRRHLSIPQPHLSVSEAHTGDSIELPSASSDDQQDQRSTRSDRSSVRDKPVSADPEPVLLSWCLLSFAMHDSECCSCELSVRVPFVGAQNFCLGLPNLPIGGLKSMSSHML